MSFIKKFRLLYMSKPVEDRVVYQVIQKLAPRSILEIGLQRGDRSLQMIEWAAECAGSAEKIKYVGIDLFEGREPIDGAGMSLRKAHNLFKATGAKIQLMPGEPGPSVTRLANTLNDVQLIVVATPRINWLDPVWFFLPRMLHDEAVMLIGRRTAKSTKAPYEFKTLTSKKIDALAQRSEAKRRAA